MKLLIASDLHGSTTACEAILERFKAEGCEKMLLLGDILAHGPRNGLHDTYDPPKTIALLETMADKMMIVCGNCDAVADQFAVGVPFPIFQVIHCDGYRLFATHGDVYNPNNPPKLKKGDILLNGHTHIVACKEYENFTYINPGSLYFSRSDKGATYVVFEDGVFTFKTLDGKEFDRYEVKV